MCGFEMWQMYVVPAVFLVMSAVGFALMGADKRRAERGAWRIPEKVLFGVSFLLGGAGSLDQTCVFSHPAAALRAVVSRGDGGGGVRRLAPCLRLSGA